MRHFKFVADLTLNKYPCIYGLDDGRCGQPSVYRSLTGGETFCFCEEHAQEIADDDARIWLSD